VTATGAQAHDSQSVPWLHVVAGSPTPAELAALVAVLATVNATPDPPPVARSTWTAGRGLRREASIGGWRASGLLR
jgi:hypothetical protein